MKRIAIVCLVLIAGTAYAPISSKRSFNSGIWAPKLAGRQDVRKYYSACRELENMLVQPQGPVYKRSGSYYIGAATGANRIISFEHSQSQAYILEFGDETMRFYK